MFKNAITLRGAPGEIRAVALTPDQIYQSQQSTAKESLQTIPEIDLLRTIPGIGPFMAPDLIPDLLWIVQTEGLRDIISKYYPGNEQVARQVMDIYQRGNLEGTISWFVKAMQVADPAVPGQLIEYANRFGITKLAPMVAAADPNNPASIIFQHSSQKGFQDIQKIEIELIANEPDVVERDDIQCACGKSKVMVTPIQLRSADEGNSFLIRCVVCKREWVRR